MMKTTYLADDYPELVAAIGDAGDAPFSLPDLRCRQASAAVQAERDRLLDRIETLHKPFRVYDLCDHEHSDEDVREGRAFDINEVGRTCAFLYSVCAECCTDDGYMSEECAIYHDHGGDLPICPTAALIAEERAR